MFWGRTAQKRAAVDDARRACLQLGATIFTKLRDPDILQPGEYMILTPEEFQSVRMFAREERPDIRLDCIWAVEDDTERYYVRMDWDIRQVTEL